MLGSLTTMQSSETGSDRRERLPEPPYFAVIFTSVRRADGDSDAGEESAGRTDTPPTYAATAQRMLELARQQPGFLGFESARGADGLGITVSYWESEEAIRRWRDDAEHRVAQALGREQWYARFTLRVAKVERAWEFPVR
jgi:heme-degrading monooxygenase HmoA